MDNATCKSKSNKNINENHDTNFQYHIRPKPRTRRKTKPHPSNELPQNRGLYSAISESSMCYPMSPLPPAIPIEHHASVSFLPVRLGNDEISITSDDTREADEILEESNELTSLDFEEEMITLKKDYCKLSRELSKTKKELAFVKSIVQNQNVHSPLLITDIIKEIQNAADAREEAFMARVQSIVDQSSIAQTPPPKLDCSSCKSVLERLEAVESQIKQLSLNSDQKKTTNLFEELRIGGGVKSTGYTGSNDTGYTSSNGLNPFAFSRESSVSPSTEL
ncbi:uncharacterized protein LOC103524932 [Diaphorina citri]|uniref:Uncharacterized protein LOC103524932 n=1 Tax=Diaphorina citri TaxID=121845 RepID=A0A1S3DUG3_DIACI|nr:uncharacterized protein LOC103524932 [Diaphorina citri]